MYKVLLVDDEKIILDSISTFIDWQQIGTELIGTARNGIEALEKIKELEPDIVITDIKMPGMDGLELIEAVYKWAPDIQFIMLSGFSEFNYAKQAMQYGVRHYLVKPCNEQAIIEAIEEIQQTFEEQKEQENFVLEMKERLEHVLPYAKEQLLKEFVMQSIHGEREIDYLAKIFRVELDEAPVRLILFQIEGEFDYEHMFAIKNIGSDTFTNAILSCTIGDYVLMIIYDEEQEQLMEKIQNIRESFFNYYKLDTTVAISDAGLIVEAKSLYQQTLACVQHRFYIGEGAIITQKDIKRMTYIPQAETEFMFDDQKFCILVKTGKWEDVQENLESFFQQFKNKRLDIQSTRSHVIQLYNSMIRLLDPGEMTAYLTGISKLIEVETIQQMHQLFTESAKEITTYFYNENKRSYSKVVQRVIDAVEREIANPDLSLNHIAQNELFMSADYLGKLFKKETGERFSNYLTKIRIEKAKELIEEEQDIKFFEIAEKLGYNDAQYFSQVFKRQTGYTPTEYKKVNQLM